MARKTRFVAFDWSSADQSMSSTQSPNSGVSKKQGTSTGAQPTITGLSSNIQFTDCNVEVSPENEESQSRESPWCLETSDVSIIDTLPWQSLRKDPFPSDVEATTEQDIQSFGLSTTCRVYTSTPIPLIKGHALTVAADLQDGFEKLSLVSDSGYLHPKPIDEPHSLQNGPNGRAIISPFAEARPLMSSLSGPPSVAVSPLHSTSMARSTSSPVLTKCPSHMDKIWPRKPVQIVPRPGKVYFVPDGRYFKDSIIHSQKNQRGFFRHPVLVIDVDGPIVNFYAMTKERPSAIRDLNMALRLGTNEDDLGPTVLRLAPYSNIMLQETWINLEQRFYIEWKNLDDWAVNVQVDPEDLDKIHRRVIELEADQNRYIYKPLLRAMSTMQPGMIIMLKNAPGSATFGAPIVVIENNYPEFHFLRVKRFEDNINFNLEARRQKGTSRQMSLAITKYPRIGHDGTPVMILESDSPAMREESYVEVHGRPQLGRLDRCKTWCWPPVRIDHLSMVILRNYMADTVTPVASYSQNPPQPNMSTCHGPVIHPPTTATHAGYYQPPQGTPWQAQGPIQQPGYHMYPPMLTPVYPAGNYMYGSHSVFQPRPESGSGHNPYNTRTT